MDPWFWPIKLELAMKILNNTAVRILINVLIKKQMVSKKDETKK